jgi:acyl-CoA thioesterase-1
MLRRAALVFPLLLLSACAEVSEPAPEPVADSTAVVAEAPAAAGAPPQGAAPACRGTAPPADGDGVLTVVFFGDSLTAGYGLADPATQAYPALVEAEARAAGLAVHAVNAGVSGETSAGGLRRVAWLLGSTRPDVFVLALGANDGLRGLDAGALQANLEGILACVREAAPEARLAVAGMEALPNFGADYAGRFRAVFPAVARRFDATLIPFLLDGVGGVAGLNQSDGVHPTAEGQRVMAETVWETLAPVLRAASS